MELFDESKGASSLLIDRSSSSQLHKSSDMGSRECLMSSKLLSQLLSGTLNLQLLRLSAAVSSGLKLGLAELESARFA